ncbi:MAG: DUF2946 domain-containing protein [Burkholderiaceae bacterium]|nr:DUF2946 domain-containing protein [Burkholderiaceae bacterium]
MQTLRRARVLSRLVLVWFVLAVGAAVASPMVKPRAMELVCTSSGAMKLVLKADPGSAETPATMADCSVCLISGAPPPAVADLVTLALEATRSPLGPNAAPRGILSAAPPPGRGPPLIS